MVIPTAPNTPWFPSSPTAGESFDAFRDRRDGQDPPPVPPMVPLGRDGQRADGQFNPSQESESAISVKPLPAPRVSRFPGSESSQFDLSSAPAPVPSDRVVTRPPLLMKSKSVRSKRYTRSSVSTLTTNETDAVKHSPSVDSSSVKRSGSVSAVKRGGSVSAVFSIGR